MTFETHQIGIIRIQNCLPLNGKMGDCARALCALKFILSLKFITFIYRIFGLLVRCRCSRQMSRMYINCLCLLFCTISKQYSYGFAGIVYIMRKQIHYLLWVSQGFCWKWDEIFVFIQTVCLCVCMFILKAYTSMMEEQSLNLYKSRWLVKQTEWEINGININIKWTLKVIIFFLLFLIKCCKAMVLIILNFYLFRKH